MSLRTKGHDAIADQHPRGSRQRWAVWIPYATAAWSLAYGALGLSWALGLPGFPFGRGHDPSASLTVFAGADPIPGGIVIAVLGVLGAMVAIAVARSTAFGVPANLVFVFACAATTTLVLVVPDYRPLLGLAYAPIIILGAPFDWPGGVDLLDVLPWPVVNQLACIAGGVLWAGTAVVLWRRMHGPCARHGRRDGRHATELQARAERLGLWATVIAIVVPLLYAATRFTWALGIPLGISEEFLREGQRIGLWGAGAALASLAVGGAILTLGLIRPWGETFPGWFPIVGGRRVPVALAIIPASVVALLVTSAGMMFVRLLIAGTFTNVFAFAEEVGWIALAPELLWPIWGVALGIATIAYYLRRRG